MADRKNDNTDKRGFASMDPEKQRQIASEGGRAAHESGHAHEFDSQEAREAGRKGGEAVSQDREHMSEIGRKGGEAVSRDREHMSEIGREGGRHSHGGGRSDSDSDSDSSHRGGSGNFAENREKAREAGRKGGSK